MIKCNACVDGFDCYTDENGDDQLCEVCGGTRYIIEEDIFKKTKGITICKAKKCNEPLYNNQSTSNKEYCMRCG